MRARYYDPATQQFISRDPMEGMSGQPYVYAGGSPLNATDVSGRFLDTLFDIAGIGLDVKDIADNGLSWENGLTLVADVGLALVPFLPAGAGAAARAGKALSHADDSVVLYHGSRDGIIGGKLDLAAARSSARETHLTGEGIYFTDDFERAAIDYATPHGWVARVSVPKSLADTVRTEDRVSGKLEWVFTEQWQVDILNQTLEILPQPEAIRQWWGR